MEYLYEGIPAAMGRFMTKNQNLRVPKMLNLKHPDKTYPVTCKTHKSKFERVLHSSSTLETILHFLLD